VRQTIAWLTGCALIVGVSACGARVDQSGTGPIGAASPASPTSAAPAPAVADPWRSFPVDRHPRPIVLLSALPEMAGFTTDEAKLAASAGMFELAAGPPQAPRTVTAQLPDGPAQFSTLPLDSAVKGLRAIRAKGAVPDGVDPLRITKIELGTAEFSTDRGRISLPAWLFHPVDALGPIAWPALPDGAFWPHDPRTSATPPATLAADGTLTVSLPAAPEPCPGQPAVRTDVDVTESATAVVVRPRPAPGPAQGDCARAAILRFEQHQVRLANPLGARVLLDEQGTPIAVTH
jgi:hypothetical protein